MSGDREYFYIGDRDKSTSGIKGINGIWRPVLKYGVLSASHFEVRFPDETEEASLLHDSGKLFNRLA